VADLGIEPVAETPEEFARFIAAEVARDGELLRSANFKPV
jgi:tripartite-type tricarboxylate transporter receptor subunit TctC